MAHRQLNKEICMRERWQEILDFAEMHLAAMDQVNLCTSLHRCAKNLRVHPKCIPDALQRPIWNQMLEKLRTLLTNCKPQELANCVWALGVVQCKDETFLEAWCPVAQDMLTQYLPQNLSNTFWALARLQWRPPAGFLHQIVHVGMERVGDFSPQDMANFSWSLARTQHLGAPKAQEICPKLCAVSLPLLPQFQPQNISNMVWALATAQVQGQEPFIRVALEQFAVEQLPLFKPQEMANTMWALATLNVRVESFILKAVEHMVPKLQLTCCQDLSNTLWALGFLKVRPSNDFIRAINWQIIRTVSDFSGQGLCNIVWGLANLDYRVQMLLDRLDVSQCGSRDVSNILWSLASLSWRHDELVLNLVAHLVSNCLKDLNVQGLCNTV